MADYEMTPPYSLSGNNQYATALSSIYKANLTAFKDAQKQEFDRAKGTVASLIDSFHKSKSQSLQENIVNTMKSYYTSLPGPLKKAVDPYIAHGPTSPLEEKKRQFTQMYPAPQLPKFDETKGDAADMKNRSAYISYLFKNADYDKAYKTFIFGSEAAPDKTNFIPLADGTAAIRNKDGMVTVLNQSDLAMKDIQEKYGITPKDILLHPHGIPTGEKNFVNVHGRRIETETTFMPWAPKGEEFGQRIVGQTALPTSTWDIKHPDRLVRIMLEWKMKDPKDKGIADLKDRAERKDLRPSVEADLHSMFPQYSFKILEIPKKESWLKRVLDHLPIISAAHGLALIPIRGNPTPFADVSGKQFTFYYDPSIDLVSNQYGQPLGSYDEAKARIAAETIK